MLKHERIREELVRQLTTKRVKAKDVAAALGIDPARVTEMKKFERRVQPEEMETLAAFLKMDSPDGERLAYPEGAEPTAPIPLLGDVPAGPWREAITHTRNFIPAPQAGLTRDAYALKVRGDSMDRIAQDGAVIIIDPTDFDLFERRLFVVRNGDGEVTFKQYRESPARLVPCSSNPAHKAIPVTDRGYEIVGRVVKIVMDPDQAALD